eukprot:2951664-Amphidinium_carterae.1
MYAGRQRVLIQGTVSQLVIATHGMPPGCGHAVDLIHAFLLSTLQSAGRHISVRNLCYGYRQVHRGLTAANMQVNLKNTVVICNGTKIKHLLMKVWRAGRLPPPRISTHDLLTPMQCLPLSCAAQTCGHVSAIYEMGSLTRVSILHSSVV